MTAAQHLIDCLTHPDREAHFGDDREAWYDAMEQLWHELSRGAVVHCASLGTSRITRYGECDLIRPSRIISSGNPGRNNVTYAIMTADHADDLGAPPYVMVCYDRYGHELARIDLAAPVTAA